MTSIVNRGVDRGAFENGRPTIAVMTGSFASFYQTSIHFGAADFATRAGYNTVSFAGGAFKHPDATQFSRTRIFDIVDVKMFDGLIIPVGSHSRHVSPVDVRAFLAQYASIPVVNIDSNLPGVPTVYSDYGQGMRELVTHLITVHGHKRFAFMRGPAGHGSSELRFRAFLGVLAEHGLRFDETRLLHADLNRYSGAKCIDAYLQKRKLDVDVLLTVNDSMALGAMDALSERGIRLPQDLVVTGSGGVDEGMFYDPPLSTVREPMYHLGWYAAKSVIDLIEGRPVVERIRVPTRMLLRGSCGCSAAVAERYNRAALTVDLAETSGQAPAVEEGPVAALTAAVLIRADSSGRLSHASPDAREVRSLAESLCAALQQNDLSDFFALLTRTLDAHTESEDIEAWLACTDALQDHALAAYPSQSEARHTIERRFAEQLRRTNTLVSGFRAFESDKYVNLSREISFALNSSFDLERVRKLVLRDMGVTDFYINLYQDKNNISRASKTMLAIRGGERLDLDEAQRIFPTNQLLPKGIAPHSEPYAMLALPLWFRAEALGFIVINARERRGPVYENLQTLLSGALKNELQIHDLTEAEQRFSDIAHSTSDWLWEVDADCRFTFCSGGVDEMIGYSATEMLGRGLFDFLLATESDYLDTVQNILIPGREAFFGIESVNMHRKGHEVTLLIAAKPIIKGGNCVGYRGLFKDITEIKQKENKIKLLAYSDGLTGLPNRTLFNDRLEQTLALARRDVSGFAILFLDLDRFKYVNDTLGHDAGDQLLKIVAQRLQDCIREIDTLARLGGDEFTIVLSRVPEPEMVALVARRIVAALNEPFEIKGQRLFVTTSVGISLYPQDGSEASTLLKNADQAMYKAKEQGKNRFVFFDQAADEQNTRRASIENGLRLALDGEGLQLMYQPLIDTQSGRIHGVEALVRLNTPALGSVSPMEFIPVAEDVGLIERLGEWVFRTACQQSRVWADKGHRLRMSVNVSARQFKNEQLAELFLGIIHDAGIEPSMIEVEITENTVIESESQARNTLQIMRDAGVSVALDDFGTGYSSLSILQNFPITTVKIDRSFVSGPGVEMDIGSESGSSNIVKAIIYMTKTLGLKVVAEGVETQAQLNFLRNQDCDLLQGYLFSKPVPPETLEALLTHRPVLSAMEAE